MRRLVAVTLGVLTAVGGFVDVGELVASSQAGALYGLRLAWVPVLGVIAICAYAEMAGRVAAMSGRAAFDLVRERLGPRVALANLIASYASTLLTLSAEVGGAAIAVQLATKVSYLFWVPVVALILWFVLRRVRFETMERVFGLCGLALGVFVAAVLALHPHWTELGHQAVHPANEARYWYFAVALFASTVAPYEVFFFSSGAVEEHWTPKDLSEERANVFVGFPLGGLLSIALMASAWLVFGKRGIEVETLAQAAHPAAVAFGTIGLCIAILGFFAATFGAALETGLAASYAVCQYFGWPWGKRLRPKEAKRFHAVVLASVIAGTLVLFTTIDPIQLTEYMLIFSAVVLPLTYLPILIVANDRAFVHGKVNGRLANAVGTVVLVLFVIASLAAIGVAHHHGSGPMNKLGLQNQLLDRQVQDRAGKLIGKVDDIELDPPRVTAILLGRQALAARISAPLARRIAAQPTRVPFDLIQEIGSAVVLSVRAELLARGHGNHTIRVSNIIGRRARDRDGRVLGRVAELMAERQPDGEVVVTEVIVVPRAGLRLTNAEVAGPWPLRVLADAFRGKTLRVPWSEAELD